MLSDAAKEAALSLLLMDLPDYTDDWAGGYDSIMRSEQFFEDSTVWIPDIPYQEFIATLDFTAHAVQDAINKEVAKCGAFN